MNANKPITERDTLFAQPGEDEDFAFDQHVAAVFPDMIRRSVPGYDTVVALTGQLAAKHLRPGGRCYDLGCSLGAAAHAVARASRGRRCEIIAVDDSAAMLERARALAGSASANVRWLEADVRALALQPADVVILNYTLQFLAPADRLPLLRKARAALANGGALIVSEKLAACQRLEDLHMDFKRANGYSELEIARKRNALENVMRIDSEATHAERLRAAGFRHVSVWFRCLNWASFIALPQ